MLLSLIGIATATAVFTWFRSVIEHSTISLSDASFENF